MLGHFLTFISLIGSAAVFSYLAFDEPQFGMTDVVWAGFLVSLIALTALGSIVAIILRDFTRVLSLLLLLFVGSAIVTVFAAIYMRNGIQGVCPLEMDFPTALYFSIVTWTTLGYGDLQPTMEMRLFAAAQATMGYLFLGTLVGLISNAAEASSRR